MQYPARHDRHREQPEVNLRKLALQVFSSLKDLPPKPTALFGHSMGATVAFEVSQLSNTDQRLKFTKLFASSRKAPLSSGGELFNNRSDNAILNEVLNLGGTDRVLLSDPELKQSFIRTIRSDYQALDCYIYRHSATLDTPIIGLVGDTDTYVSMKDLEKWGYHTHQEFQLHVMRGGHFYFHNDEETLAAVISDHLC